MMNVVEEGRYKGNLMYIHFHQMNDIPPDYEILPKESDGRFLISVPYGGPPILAGEFDKLLITFKEV